MYKRWAARPREHRAELTAMLGTTKMEDHLKINRNRQPWKHGESTPWAAQMEEDLGGELAE
eukprot:7918089-Lingulodinium_polyedra.AAC.1